MAENKKAEPVKKEAAAPKAVKAKKKTGPRGPRKSKEPRAADAVHLGQIIVRVMKSRGLSKNKLAKILNLTAPTISLMVKSHSVQTDRLITISKVLGYNFFTEIGEMINVKPDTSKNIEQPGDPKMKNLQSKVFDLEAEMRFIKEENIFLRHIIELLAGQGKK
jgi:plasmid maintenance system antidote protein VapI